MPAFFGAHTRYLFDNAVSWNGMEPVPSIGGPTGFPFGQRIRVNGGWNRYAIGWANDGRSDAPGKSAGKSESDPPLFLIPQSQGRGLMAIAPRLDRPDGGLNHAAMQ